MGQVNALNEWTRTDDLQWVKTLTETAFTVIDMCETVPVEARYENFRYILKHVDVELANESDQSIEHSIKAFGYTLESVKEIYSAHANQIIAECMAENEAPSNDLPAFEKLDQLAAYLQTKYNIHFELWDDEEE